MSDNYLITGASQLLTLRGGAPRRGTGLSNLGIIRDGAILIRDDRIVAVGPRKKVEAHKEARGAEQIDVGGRVSYCPKFRDSRRGKSDA